MNLPYDVMDLIARRLPEQAVWRLGSVNRYARSWLLQRHLPARIRATGWKNEISPNNIVTFYQRYFVCEGCGMFDPDQDPRDHDGRGRWMCGKCEKRRTTAQLDMMDLYGRDHPCFYQEGHHDADF